jgi:hypothetical protein
MTGTIDFIEKYYLGAFPCTESAITTCRGNRNISYNPPQRDMHNLRHEMFELLRRMAGFVGPSIS